MVYKFPSVGIAGKDYLLDCTAGAPVVPRMLRSATSAFTRAFDTLCLAAWCAADPGSIVPLALLWGPALRSSVKYAAPRPGHEELSPPCGDLPVGQFVSSPV
jgi:hypothetical protein